MRSSDLNVSLVKLTYWVYFCLHDTFIPFSFVVSFLSYIYNYLLSAIGQLIPDSIVVCIHVLFLFQGDSMFVVYMCMHICASIVTFETTWAFKWLLCSLYLTLLCHMLVFKLLRHLVLISSMQTGPLLCNKPILRSTVPSLCPTHYQKGEKYLIRDLRKAGLNVSSVSKLAPKFHVIVAEYISQIQTRRRAAQKAIVGKVELI